MASFSLVRLLASKLNIAIASYKYKSIMAKMKKRMVAPKMAKEGLSHDHEGGDGSTGKYIIAQPKMTIARVGKLSKDHKAAASSHRLLHETPLESDIETASKVLSTGT